MAEPSPSADPLSTNLPGRAGASALDHDGVPEKGASRSRFKQKKLLAVLGAAALGGVLLGVGGMVLTAYLQPAAKEPHALPVIAAPTPDPKQGALVTELQELKAKNEKLEEQLKQSSQTAPISALALDAAPLPASIPPSVPAPAPTILHGRSAGKDKEKITADCTVPDSEKKISDKLKSCIEDFNANTR